MAGDSLPAELPRRPDGLCVVDGDGAIVYVNQSGLRMLGYEADELIGRDGHAVLHHRPAPGVPSAPEQAALTVRPEREPAYETLEDCFWRKDGSMLPVFHSSSPVPLRARAPRRVDAHRSPRCSPRPRVRTSRGSALPGSLIDCWSAAERAGARLPHYGAMQTPHI